MNKIPKILYVARDDGGCGYYRCVQPANFMKRAGLADATVVLRTPTDEQLKAADLVIMQESGSQNATKIVQFLLKNDIPYLSEFDDFIHHVSPRNVSGYGAWNPSTLYVHRSVEAMRSAFGATVSTPQLAREFFPYNPTIYVIPNYLDKDLWDNPTVKRGDDKIRIGWAGGNAHADDLHTISKVIDKIVKESKGKVVFETMGMTKQELHGVFPMQVTDSECPSCGYEGELHHHPGEALQDYPLILAAKGWDIAVAPVINNAFGNAKSDLKIKEYAAIGVPVVASRVVPYLEAANDGAAILFADTFEEWYNSLRLLIDDHDKRNELVRQNKEWVSRYWIQDNIAKTFEVYHQTIAKADVVLRNSERR